MTGGESLMDKNTFKVMEYVLENSKQGFRIKHNNKHVSINNVLFERFIGLLKQLDNVEHSAEVYVF